VAKRKPVALAGAVDARDIGLFMRYWTSQRTYLSRLGIGKPRIALDGSSGEPATEEERRFANKRLLGRLRRIRAHQ
jgi:sRNA-binding protein